MFGELEMFFRGLLHVRRGNETNPVVKAEADRSLRKADTFDATEDFSNPWVVFSAFKAPEWLAESKMADEIKGGEVVPSDHIDTLSFPCFLGKLLDEQIDVVHQKVVLLAECLVGKRMGKKLSLALVVFVLCDNQTWSRTALSVKSKILSKLAGSAGFVTVDCLVSIGRDEGDIVVSVSNHRAVLLVQLLQTIYPLASSQVIEIW